MTENVVSQQTEAPETSPAEALADFRRHIQRYADHNASLPLDTQASCPDCGEVRTARFERKGKHVTLTWDCQRCGHPSVAHHDAIWTDLASPLETSHTHTLTGSRIRPVIRGLPRTIETLCPACCSVIIGRYFVRDGQVWIEKACPEHGYFRDKISADVGLFSKASWWSFHEHPGQQRPQRTGEGTCPGDCGLCSQHLSSPVLAQVDLTNRCNMRCPICFANANAQGYIFEPPYEEIVRQMQELRDMRPTPTTAIQFSGGEPTIHPDFLKIIRTAGEMGFSHIQIATNGMTMSDLDFAQQCHDAGLHTLYLQFDGIGEAAYVETRNHPGIWKKKLAAIENCRNVGMKVCLVPTIVKGINDDQIPGIFQFALDNIDVISGISWQPVSFTGRMSVEELEAHRYTLGDLGRDLADIPQANLVALRDLYPVGTVLPLSELLEAISGDPKIRASCHPDCAFGTYFLVSPTGQAYPWPSVVNVEGLFWDMYEHAQRIKKKGRFTWLDKLRLLRMFKRHWRPESAPPDLDVKRLIRTIMGMVDKKVGRGEGEKQTYKTLLCAGMHFQDRYNFDVERVKRCVILYSTSAGVFPFCTHNCGPEYRYLTQAEYMQPTSPTEPTQTLETNE
ncbi:MAG: radical SAM protein [Planctomycetes bacterium]|jgi:uncharacterized radical SAM superfamily Fe-S cluster-containing enzyme|nr:radical SAM protein [Phycisphaerae bacterium]NBB95643.1 radical SAM protein [Planctomycetota bacterium]